MTIPALKRLAHDIADNFRCDCYTDDLETEDCPCGGDGRDNERGDAGALEGCWNCQARAALAVVPIVKPAIPAKTLTFGGLCLTLREWAQRLGITKKTLICRLKAGWPLDRALSAPSGKPSGTFGDRFWAKMDRSAGPDGCWIWRAKTSSGGYGRVLRNKRFETAHRVAYELLIGPIGPGLVLRHVRCVNRRCCNPSHMEPGTHQENMDDMVFAGRSTTGERNPGAKLSEVDVRMIRQGRLSGESARLLAREYGVTETTIRSICSGKSWKKAS